jgi:hypothetical protein
MTKERQKERLQQRKDEFAAVAALFALFTHA